MSKLCNHCECVNINSVRCHEEGCPNTDEDIKLSDDGTLDTVFVCGNCTGVIRYTFDPTDYPNVEDEDDETAYDEFVYWALRDAQDTHECEEFDEDDIFNDDGDPFGEKL